MAGVSRIARGWLLASGLLCTAGALLHLLIPFGGPAWYAFAGAPEGLVAMATAGMARPVATCVVIASMLAVFSSYAFSAMGFIRRLPAVRVALALTGLALSARAAWLPILAINDPWALGRFCGRCSGLNGFVVASSALCLFIGIGYLLGAWQDPAIRRSPYSPDAAV